MMRNGVLIVFVLFFFYSCNKDEKDNNALYKLDIDNVLAITLSPKPNIGADEDSLALYKIIEDDKLYEIALYNSDLTPLSRVYAPVAIYNLNDKYFLLSLKMKGSNSFISHSYIINKSDGIAKELKGVLYPCKNLGGNWEIDYSADAIKNPSENVFYFPGENKISKLTIQDGNDPEIVSYNIEAGMNYEVDTSGNILLGNRLIYKNDSTDELNFISNTTIVVRRHENGFYLIDRMDEKILISRLLVGENSYELISENDIINFSASWNYLGNTTFPYYKSSLLVYDKGLIYLDTNQHKVIPVTTLGLSSVYSYYSSENYLYIIGLNLNSEEVFVKVKFGQTPPSYTSLFTPGNYKFYLMDLNKNNSLSFYAKRINDAREIIGYLTSTLYINLVENDQFLKPKQFVTLK